MHKRTAMECDEKMKVAVRADYAEYAVPMGMASRWLSDIGFVIPIAWGWREFSIRLFETIQGEGTEKVRERCGKDREPS